MPPALGTSGASGRGKLSLENSVRIAQSADPTLVNLAFDAETSGGLLIVVPAERAGDLERELAARDQLVAAVGQVITSDGAHVEFV